MTTTSEGSILTVGHSNIPFGTFADNLRKNGVGLIVDVRSHPRSRYTVQFNASEIERSLRDGGMGYEYMGEELGGRPQSDAFYDEAGYVRYDALADSDLFLRGITHLRGVAARHRVAVMCSEEDPVGCHRYLLVGRVLADLGYEVGHIRRDGRIERQDEVTRRAQRNGGGGMQLSLLPDREKQWRSERPIRSVSPSVRQRNSSGP